MLSGSLILRGREVEDPLAVALAFAEKYLPAERARPRPVSFDERDLRSANRGGARISAAEIAAVLERRQAIERSLRGIRADASLAAPAASIPWTELARLFEAFAGIRGVGLSKMTKALHPKRPALIPMLDSVVQAYLVDEPAQPATVSFAARATALVRSYKRDLDGHRAEIRLLCRELERRGHEITEVRLLDVLIWSVAAGA